MTCSKCCLFWISKCLYTQLAVWCSTTFDYTHGPKIIKHATQLFLSFCYAPKRPIPFLLYIPTRNPPFNDKVWTYYRILVSKWVKSQKMEKAGPPTNPATAPPQKFLLLLQYYLSMGVNKMRVKNITVTVSVRVSAVVRVSLVWFVSSKGFATSSVAICRLAVCKLIAFCLYTRLAMCIGKMQSTCTRESWLHLAIHTAGRVYSIFVLFWLYTSWPYMASRTRPAGWPCV